MNKYPTVNYIGNKQKICEWIIKCLPVNNGTILDLFCGGCSVSYELKNKGYNVIANDSLYSNYVLAKAIIENSNVQLYPTDFCDIIPDKQEILKTLKKFDFLKNNIYFDYEVEELANLKVISDRLPKYKKEMFLALLRRAMIRKIPYSRMNVKWEEIKKFRDEEYSYKKYGRYRHYHNIPFIEHIYANIDEYNNSLICNNTNCIAIQMNALDCIKSLDKKIDVIYMDPPYPSTMNKYKDFYGYFDFMFDRELENITDLTNKNTFLDNLEDLIKEANKKTNYIAISLNNKCYPSVEVLVEKIKPYIKNYVIYKKDHVYKVTGKQNKHNNYELLLVCEMIGG